uniref:aspartate-semialdehyde dehydrogenase n=1 Tax=Hematodinium sp. SG-2015 TaxID=1649283 RepID=A0A0F7C9G0_9DINO|nr:aspartate-semialdehyde dehydrogenase [Hematodinium sp. SG-2015]
MAPVFGIVGATGAVGREMIRVLCDRQPTCIIRLFASSRSAGTIISISAAEMTVTLTVEEFSVELAQECDIVLLAVSGSFAQQHAKAISEKAIVIDNSSAFRYDADVPLVVPEINPPPDDARLIANPNCTTAIAAMALWPLHCAFGLKKVIVSSYQAASGAGQEGMQELREGTKQFLNGEEVKHSVFSHPLPFNVIPHIDVLQPNGYTKEEMKVVWETQKIFQSDVLVSCTAVRIPTMRAHAEAITIETEKEISVDAARAILEKAPGIVVIDDVEKLQYPTSLSASGKYDVEVGRLRQSLVFGSKGLDLFVCGDQLLRGAALNAVLIAETLL